MKKNVKKLRLNKETLRALQDSELRQVAGGEGNKVQGQACPYSISWCPTMGDLITTIRVAHCI